MWISNTATTAMMLPIALGILGTLHHVRVDRIEMKRALRDKVIELREARGLTQQQLAKLIGSGQPRISKLEAGDPSVGYDLYIKTLLTLGATPSQIGAAIATSE